MKILSVHKIQHNYYLFDKPFPIILVYQIGLIGLNFLFYKERTNGIPEAQWNSPESFAG